MNALEARPRRRPNQLLSLLTAILICAGVLSIAGRATAFEECDRVESELSDIIKRNVRGRTPVQYRSIYDQVVFVTGARGAPFLPFADKWQATPRVVFPQQFARAACEIVFSQYLSVLNDVSFDGAAMAGAKCLEVGTFPDSYPSNCLQAYATQLAAVVAPRYLKMSRALRGQALNFFWGAMIQVAMHEYAHHYLGHTDHPRAAEAARVLAAQKRAEFEADLFAVNNGLLAGEVGNVMGYLFTPLARVDRYRSGSDDVAHFSYACRSSNIMNIARATEISVVSLVDVFEGGGSFRDSRGTFHVSATLLRTRPSFEMNAACPGGTANELMGLHDELLSLTDAIEPRLEVLLPRNGKLDRKKAEELLTDLVKRAQDNNFVGQVAAQGAAALAFRISLQRSAQSVQSLLEPLTQTGAIKDNLTSTAYGRLQAVIGNAFLRQRPDLDLPTRLERADDALRRAVYFEAELSDAWANLGLIAFKKGDCSKAAHLVASGINTSSAPPEQLLKMKRFALWLNDLSKDPTACRAEGNAFVIHPTQLEIPRPRRE